MLLARRPAKGLSRLVERLSSSYTTVAVPLNLFDLPRSYIDLEGAIASDPAFPILRRDDVVTWRHRDPKPALIVSREGCNHAIFRLYEEFNIRERFRIGNATS